MTFSQNIYTVIISAEFRPQIRREKRREKRRKGGGTTYMMRSFEARTSPVPLARVAIHLGSTAVRPFR